MKEDFIFHQSGQIRTVRENLITNFPVLLRIREWTNCLICFFMRGKGVSFLSSNDATRSQFAVRFQHDIKLLLKIGLVKISGQDFKYI